MKKESLEKARNVIIERIINSNLSKEDKVELMINIYNFLQPNDYEKNIKILNKERGRK